MIKPIVTKLWLIRCSGSHYSLSCVGLSLYWLSVQDFVCFWVWFCKSSLTLYFHIKSPKFDTEKERSTALKGVIYAMNYRSIYQGNIADKKPLPDIPCALRITSYVIIPASTRNWWSHGKSINKRNKYLRMISGNDES